MDQVSAGFRRIHTAAFGRWDNSNDLRSLSLRPGRQLVMLEIPLLPFYNEYGRIQRALARRFDVALIPKRSFAGVLASAGATLDGLHLSATGHELMARMVGEHIGPSLKSSQGGLLSR